jgi:hypothetical protein
MGSQHHNSPVATIPDKARGAIQLIAKLPLAIKTRQYTISRSNAQIRSLFRTVISHRYKPSSTKGF